MHDDHNFSFAFTDFFLLIKCCLSIIPLHVNLHNWHISLSSLRWNGLNGYFKYSHPDLFSLREVPLISMAEILRQADQIHLSPFLIRPFESDISCSANFPFDNGLLKWILHPLILIEPNCCDTQCLFVSNIHHT